MNCILVENDSSYALEVEMLLDELDINLIKTVKSDNEALSSILKETPDLVLMDIEIDGDLSGIEVANKLSHLDLIIIFMTSFDTIENFNKAKKANNYGFLTKPIKKFDLKSVIEVLKKNTQESDTSDNEKKLLIKGLDEFYQINKKDILYIKAEKNYSMIYLESSKFLIRYKLSELQDILPQNFLKCHRSYVINLDHIKQISFKDNLIKFGDTYININNEAKLKIEKYFEILK